MLANDKKSNTVYQSHDDEPFGSEKSSSIPEQHCLSIALVDRWCHWQMVPIHSGMMTGFSEQATRRLQHS